MNDWSKDIDLEVIKEYLRECAENDDYHYEHYQIDIVMHEYIRQKLVIEKLGEEIERLEKRNKEIYEGFNNIINTLEDSIVGKINVLYQVRGQSNAIQELSILLRQLRELKGGSSND